MNKNKQLGISFISLLIIFGVVLFFVTIVIKTVPVYMENYSVNASLVSISEEINSGKIKPKDIKAKLMKRMFMNNITRVTEENIMIAGGEEQTTLSIEYESRVPFFANIDFILTFKNSEAINL